MFDLEHEANIKRLEELAKVFREAAEMRSRVLSVGDPAGVSTRDTYQDAIADFAETAVKIIKRLDQKSVIGF
jgi:hypothetical protein